MALKTVQSWFGYGSSGTPSTAQLESRNGVLLLPQDSVIIDESNRQDKKLGEGTFAKVYVGMYMGKERAIKVFNLRSDSTVDQAREEFEKLNSLKHPNIVRVYGMWEDPHKKRYAPAIVMELCDHSLQDYIKQYHPRGSITHEHKLKILHDITCAMVYLHSRTLVHGDLRSPNVLMKINNDEVTAKLTDFGMARVLDPQLNSHVTSNVADDDYLPPEVFNHKEQRDRKKNWAKLTTQVDVFMFGPVAIELACGEFPKPTIRHEVRKGKVTRTFSEIERREQYLTKVKASDRAITDMMVKMCLAENPEDRGTFLDLQRIVKGFQRPKDQPGSADNFQDLYEDAQEELEGLRSQLEADQMSLYQQDVEQILKKEMEQLKMDNEQQIKQVQKTGDEFTEFQTKCEASEIQHKQDLFEVEEERNQAQSGLQQKNNDWETLQRKYIDQMTNFSTLTKEHDDLKCEAESLQQGFHQKDLEINSLKRKYEDTETQLTLQLRMVGEERDQARRELELQKQGRQTLQEDYNEKLKKLGDLTEEHKKLMLDHKSMQNEHTEEKEKLATEKTSELTKSKDHIKQLEDAARLGNSERAKLAQQVTELEKLKVDSDGRKKEHEHSMTLLNTEKTEGQLRWEEERVKLQLRISTLRTDLSAYQKEAASAGQIASLKDVCRRQKNEIENKEERLTAAEQSKNDIIKVLAQTKAELAELKGSCQKKDGEIAKLEAVTVQGKTDLEQLLKDKMALNESLTISQDQIPKKVQVHRELQTKFEALKTKSGKTEDELKAVKRDLSSTLQQAETLQKQLKSSSHAKSQLEIDRTSLQEKVKRLENEQVRLKAEECRLATLRVKHEGDLATIKTKEQELKTRDAAIKAHQETNRHLQIEVSKSKNSIQAKEADLKKAQLDFQFKEKQLKEAKANSSALKKLENENQDLQQKMLELEGVEQQRAYLSNQLQCLRVKIDGLEKKRSILEADCTLLESEKKAVIEERDQLKNEKEAQLREAEDSLLQASHNEKSLKASFKKLKEDLQEKETDFNHAKDSEQELSEKIAELNESLGVKEAEIERLNAAIKEDRTAVEEAKDTVKIVHKYSRERTELNAKLKEAKEQLIEAEVLKLRNEELEKALKEARDDKRREEQTEATELDAREMTEKNEQVNRLEKVVAELQEHKMTVIKEKKLLETTNNDLGDRMESLELKLRLKEEEVTELRATIERNEVRIQDAKKELKDLEKYRKRVQELKYQLTEANNKASQDKSQTTISELKRWNSQATAEERQERQDIEGPLLVEINTLKERLSQRETELQSSNGRISELERDIDASKAHSAELQSKLNHTDTGLTSTRAELDTAFTGLSNTQTELSNTQAELRKTQEQNEASSIRCQELRQHISELESAQSRLQKREDDLNQQVEVLKSERDTAQRQAQDFDRGSKDLKLKLQKTQSDYENEQKNCERERDSTKHLRTEIAQLFGRISSLDREVQALKEKSRHRREVMQQMVKSIQAQVTTVRSDLDQERSRQSDLKDSVEQLLTRSYIVRSLKTELVSRAAELQKCRDELRTAMTERDRLNQSETNASQVSMQQQLHQFQEHMTQSLDQVVHDSVFKAVADMSCVPELNRGAQQLQSQAQDINHHSIKENLRSLSYSVRWPPGGAEVVPLQQWSSPGPAVAFQQDLSLQQSSQQSLLPSSPPPSGLDSYARTTGQSTGTPSLQESVDPYLLQQTPTLRKLMPYIPYLADKGACIAGYLDMQKQWDSLASSHPELGGRLQKLFSTWLEGEEDSETPHTWDFFISLVQEKGIDQHQLARKICSNLNKAPAPNST